MDSRCFRNQKTWSLCIQVSTNLSFFYWSLETWWLLSIFKSNPSFPHFIYIQKPSHQWQLIIVKKNYIHFVDHRTPLLSLKLGSNCALLSYCRYKNIYLFYIHCLNCLILYIGCAYNARKIQQIILLLNYHIVV